MICETDLVIDMDCGCKVTYFTATKLRSSRIEPCCSHEAGGKVQKRMVQKIADRELFRIVNRMCIPELQLRELR